MSPWTGPPHAARSAVLFTTQLTARRTNGESNGGVSRFIVMYQVRSPESECRNGFSDGVVWYWCRTVGGGELAIDPSRVPALIRWKMCAVFVSITTLTPSRYAWRTCGESVAGS